VEADLNTATEEAPRGGEFPERTRWMGEGVTAVEISAELDKLHRAAGGPERMLALARTLNLIVAPCSDRREAGVEKALDRLGSHTPSRTLVLREHGEDRVDARVVNECAAPTGAGEVGLCHDRVVLTMNPARLEHSASLLAPLLVSDLPTVLWLPDPGSAIPDEALLERAQYVLVDSGPGGLVVLAKLAEMAAAIRVHDLAWGRLEYWRAATAAAFDPPEHRRLLPAVGKVSLRYEPRGLEAGLLLTGWVIARAGWRPGSLERRNGSGRIRAVRPDGGEVSIELTEDGDHGGCGGVQGLELEADDGGEVKVTRSGATSLMRDLFAEALQPQPAFSRGYAAAVSAAAKMLGGSS
jgi:glucose-6-phosphate dehydrogenase assembly protein OpcA